MACPTVWIIIPILDHIDVTRSCLADLSSQTYRNIQVVLCDSGSTDGTREAIPREFPEAAWVCGDQSWWWTKATNEGIRRALVRAGDGDLIMTLNNDVLVPADYVSAMVQMSERYPGSIVGSAIFDARQRHRLVECGVCVNWPTMKQHFLGLDDFDEGGFSERLEFLCGKGVLYPVSAFRDCGLFDEVFLPHYGADQDFVARCKKAGYTLRVQKRVPLYSREDISAPGAAEAQTLGERLKLFVVRKSRLNIGAHMCLLLRHCPRRYWATSSLFLLCRLLGHVFIKKGVQAGPGEAGLSVKV